MAFFIALEAKEGKELLCKICREKAVNKRHIEATHKIRFEDYLKEYERDYWNEKQAIEKINELYITVRHKFIQMDSKGQWITVKSIKSNTDNTIKRKYGLCDKDLSEHLNHKKTIGVYMPRGYSKFICFDIDRPDVDILEAVVNAVSSYVPREHIHISFSGNKGYHVELFFKRLVSHEVLNKFYKVILNDTGYKENIVECYGVNDKAVKLPLGVNSKNKDLYNNFCYYCNEYGVEIKNSIEYIQSIEPIEPKAIYEAVDINYMPNFFNDNDIVEIDELKEALENAPALNYSVKDKIQSIEKLIEEGITLEGTRHQSMYKIAVYLKDIKGFTQEKTVQFLTNWIKTKCSTELFKSGELEVLQDIKYTVKCIYNKDYTLSVSRKQISIAPAELKEILSVPKKNLRHLYFILFCHGKAYADKQGKFYMTYDQMGEAGANSQDKPHLKGQLEELQSYGKLEIVSSNKRAGKGYMKAPNQYRLVILDKSEHEVINYTNAFNLCDMNCDNCLEVACSYLLDNEDIKQGFNKNEVKRIKDLKGKCVNDINNK